MNVTVTKLTGVELLRKANSFTTGRDSKMSLRKAYQYGHTPIRTQLFWIEMYDIPLFCGSQFVRSKIGVDWWMLTRRTDRGAEDFSEVCHNLADNAREAWGKIDCQHIYDVAEQIELLAEKFDRHTPINLACLMNAEMVINMSRKRLCLKSSKETTKIWKEVIEKVKEVDEDLYLHLVSKCIQCGYCNEHPTCGYIKSPSYKIARETFLKLFD